MGGVRGPTEVGTWPGAAIAADPHVAGGDEALFIHLVKLELPGVTGPVPSSMGAGGSQYIIPAASLCNVLRT